MVIMKICGDDLIINIEALNEITGDGISYNFSYNYKCQVTKSRFATDQEPVKSRRESERRPTQEMTGPSSQ
ncbi:hypothetical protein CAPTEDRAFT_220673 [Capitella teleta]|uniref:Uncharacterized protein n=1 Tax=Capitella teleta TaxID=283909 RepID=R7UVR5_CAPTE|nr:hypothetical protein CAPTEDRAFT_220673 [Capitella teleta]|eukprot:ELU10688.1 hypothetical protein CAPTEDRAFT_220673 [Capitella teleta]